MREFTKASILFAIYLVALGPGKSGATGMDDLENFVKNVKTGRADFTQTVVAPSKGEQASRSKTSSGSFAFLRPGKFKFVYRKPFEQSIVADGQTLWLYDPDLNQVTARKQAQAVGTTPAALIASAGDLKALQIDFTLANTPDMDGLQWVSAVPKAADSSLQNVRIGFKAGQLAQLVILDSFGQKSRIEFSGFDAQAKVDASDFQFKPPAGVDLIRQ